MARPADPNARASLISAARAEFVRKGIRGARIEDITRACGLSKGAFYLHFPSKEALFGEVMAAYQADLDAMASERLAQVRRFFEEHGRPDVRDVALRSERYQRLVELETALDLRTLELMWAHRDVMDVLMGGAQGTPFESFFWSQLDREVERVTEDFQRLVGPREPSEAEAEAVPELFGALIVGTYVLLGKRMGQLKHKPDLAAWARTLQHLIREGCMPRQLPEAARPPVRAPRAAVSKPSTAPRPPARARASTRRTPRTPP